jgi:hypothetical protein
MPILGSTDSAAFGNTVAVTQNSATVTKNTNDTIAGGDIIVLDSVQYFVNSVDGNTVTLGKVYAGSTNATLAANKVQRRTAPKALSDFILRGATSTASTTQIIGVSRTEAQLSENKAKGLNSPGWWAYRTYTDAAGSTRHKAECIASFKDGSAISGDYADDAWAGDVTSLITISTQPADQNTSGGGATFAVVASSTGSGASLTYQWQKYDVAGTAWEDVSGETAANIALTGQTASETGDKYRVKVNNSIGGVEVISAEATLTFVN